MNLISLSFLAFVLLTVALYYALPLGYRPCVLLLTSLCFYLYADVRYIFFILFSALTTYGAALLIQRRPQQQKTLLTLTVTLNIALLAIMKYLPYSLSLLGSILHTQLPSLSLIVPLGISFYTLQSLSYLIDCCRGNAQPERSFWRYLLYLCFFPIIQQGPISRYGQLSPQLSTPHRLDYTNLTFGAQLALWGFFKKLVIADRAAILVNQVYNNYADYTGAVVILATCLYTIQLYTDFSGCVDICRGVAKMLGIDLMENFDHPLFATSIQDFWRRWHISLSSWFKDYVYIPLGGSRKGKLRKHINVVIVFLLSGLWHGVGVNYIFWGLLHGMYQVLGALTIKIRSRFWEMLHISVENPVVRLLRQIGTFLLLTFSLFFFRGAGFRAAVHMVLSMLQPCGFNVETLLSLGLEAPDLVVLALGILVLWLVSLTQQRIKIRETIAKQALPLRWCIYILALFTVIIFGVYGPGYASSQFIYMNF